MSEPSAKPVVPTGIVLSDAEKARQKRRSRAIAWGIAGLCVLFYAITVLKMGAAMFNRSL